MSKLDPKVIVISVAALLVVGALGFAVARQMPRDEPAPLAVVTIDRVAEQAAEEHRTELTALGAERDDLAAQLETAANERDQMLGELEDLRAAQAEAAAEPDSSTLVSDLATATAQRDSMAGDLERLRAELKAQGTALEAALVEAESLKQQLAQAQSRAEAEAAAATQADQSAAASSESVETVAEVPNNAAIEAAVEEGLRAYQAKDFKTAFDTWAPLAEQGVARAQFYVGALYRDGAGVNRDMVQAYVWLKRSDERGYIYAKGLLDRVSKEMNPEQLAQAEAVLGQ
ncbi:MAG: hypothetical protein AAF495_04290 [Pseudomonadota bacterium]